MDSICIFHRPISAQSFITRAVTRADVRLDLHWKTIACFSVISPPTDVASMIHTDEQGNVLLMSFIVVPYHLALHLGATVPCFHSKLVRLLRMFSFGKSGT